MSPKSNFKKPHQNQSQRHGYFSRKNNESRSLRIRQNQKKTDLIKVSCKSQEKNSKISRRFNRLFNHKGVWKMNKYIQNIKMESNRCNKRERKREVQSQESSLYVPQTEREREQKVIAKMR